MPNTGLVGQPFSIVSYMVLPILHCNCERGGVVALMAQQRAEGMQRTQESCPSCGRTFAINALSVGQDGIMQIGIEMSAPMPELVPH